MAEIDIEVKQGILETYHNYPYKSPQVFGEFIDNAIQSFEDNKNILSAEPNYLLTVNINIDWVVSEDKIVRAKSITIEDNSAGMTKQKFSEAFKSADKSTTRIGMNEFGMGMKIAACWLGKKWRVETKSLAEPETRVLEIDVEKVSKDNIKMLSSQELIEPGRKHGTKIIIDDMWPQTQIKKDSEDYLIKGIASIYRYFIRRGEIRISVNDKILSFDKYEVLKAPPYTNPSGQEVEWLCNVSQTFDKYTVSGFVALLKETKDEHRGVVIMRNHRVVMGFDPADRTVGKSFMGQVGSKKYRRVFGEMEVTGFEVAMGKNQVIDLEQLEALMEMVAGKLKVDGVSLLTQGDKYNKNRKTDKPTPEPQPTPEPEPKPVPTPKPTPPSPPVPEPIPTPTPKPTPPTPTPTPGGGLLVSDSFKYAGKTWTFEMEETTEIIELFANDSSREEEQVLSCKVNLQHPFFKYYGAPTEQALVLIKALSIANYTSPDEGRRFISRFLADFELFVNG